MNGKKMRVLSVINLKGGVAKTVSSVAIAYILAEVFHSGSCCWITTNRVTLPVVCAGEARTEEVSRRS